MQRKRCTHRSELKWRWAPPGVECLQRISNTADRQLDIRLHNAIHNNQQISFLDGMFHRHNNFVISINDVKVADCSICFLKYSKRKKKKNEFQTLTHFRIHLYYLFDFRPISGRNFPNEYWTDTSTLHVPLLVAFDWPIRRFHSRDKKGLRFSFLFVCVWSNESIPFKTRHWYWCRITSWPPSQNKRDKGRK